MPIIKTLFGVIILLSLILAGCKTPDVRKVGELRVDNELFSDVQFTLDDEFLNSNINCVAVGQLETTEESDDFADIDRESIVRQTLVGNLVSRNYSTVPIPIYDAQFSSTPNRQDRLTELDCDAVITGEITSFRTDSVVAYSATIVGLNLSMYDRVGKVIWAGRHTASNKDGAIPFSPFSLIAGLVSSKFNSENEVAMQMVDSVSRRLINTLPEVDQLNPDLSQMSLAIEQIASDDQAIIVPANLALSPQQMLDARNYPNALEAAEEEIGSGQSTFPNYFVGAEAAFQLGEYSKAIDMYLEAIAIEESADAFLGLAFSYVKTDQIQLAKVAMHKAVSQDPEDARIRYYHGLVLDVAGKPDQAAKAYYLSGELHHRKGDVEGSYKALVALTRLSNYHDAQSYIEALSVKVISTE